MKKSLKYTGYTLLTLVVLILVYLGCAWTFSHLTVKGEKQQNPDVTVYILGNGIHTDVVVPVKTDYKDWSQGILYKNTRGNDTSLQYLAIGWGDKGFYLNTPHLADLTFSTAFNAAFGLSSSAMHTTFYKSLEEGDHCLKLGIDKAQYQRLITFIENSQLAIHFKTYSEKRPLIDILSATSLRRDHRFR
jgi:uncharacterized protein (TIGR02117 family)